MESNGIALVAALVLAALHVLAGHLRFLDVVPRSRWLSIAGGTSVAYVFVHLLPELSEAQRALAPVVAGAVPFLERHAYLLALVGLALFYGVERASRLARARRQAQGGHGTQGDRKLRDVARSAAWLAIGSYAAYNALIGYLLVHRVDGGAAGLALFAFAMGVHFVVNDHGLRAHHRDLYHRWGRWVCAGGVLLGWAVGAVTEVHEAGLALLLAFLAGGVILNVLKEELPAERESRFSAFALGAAGYAALLLAL